MTALLCAIPAAQANSFAPGHGKSGAAIYHDGLIRTSSVTGMREAYLPEIYASSHAANLIVLDNGDILCFWFSGMWEGESDVGIVMSRLPKGASRWTNTRLVDRKAGQSFQNPVPFQPNPGHLLLFHTTQAAGAGQSDSQVLWLKSNDDGKKWSAPAPLFTKPGSFVRQPLVVMSTRKWMLPMYYTPSRGITTGAESNYSAIELTSDRGKTWKECVIPNSSGLVQPSVVKLKSRKYKAFFRSRYADYIYQSESNDGCHWTRPVATVLPNNNSSIQALRLSDGHLVIAFNNVRSTFIKGKPATGPRKPLSVALSTDDGKTWPWVRDIETGHPSTAAGAESTSKAVQSMSLPNKPGREEYSYPSIVQAGDGQIYVAYTYRRETIKVVSFSEDWIKDAKTIGDYKCRGN